MKMKRLLIFLLVTSLSGSAALWAGAPLGSPIAQLEKGKWQIGAELAIGEADWSAHGQGIETVIGVGSLPYEQSFQIDDLQSNTLFVLFGYGLTNDWDVFARLGGVQAESDFRVAGATPNTGNAGVTHLDNHYGLAAGLGTRATFYRRGAISLGGVLQGTWFEPGESQFSYPLTGPPSGTLVTNAQLRYLQIQLALAGVYQKEAWHAWIGPFLQHTEGDIDLEAKYDFNGVPTGTIVASGDLKNRTRVGVHLGGGLQVKRCTYRLEGQFTDQSWLLGVSGTVAVK